MLIPALDFLTALELDARELLECAANAGCKAAGLLVQPWGGLPFPDPGLLGNPGAVNALARTSRDLGVRIDTIEVFMIDEGCDIESYRPALELGAQLGASAANGMALDFDEGRLAENYGRFCEMAAEYNLAVLCEIHRLTPLHSIATAVQFFDRLGLDVKIELDALHFFRYGGQVDEIFQYASRIGRAQICDGVAQATDAEYMTEAVYRRQVPGDGDLPLTDFLSALPDDIIVGVEVPRPDYRTAERIARSVSGFRTLMRTIDRPLDLA